MNQDEIDAQYIDFLTGQLESSDDPEDLAKYVEAGGTLDEGLRSYIASLIRKYAPKSRGGRNQKRDCDVYLRVEFWRLMQRGLGLPAQATGDAAGSKELTNAQKTSVLPTRRVPKPSINDGLEHLIETDPELRSSVDDVNIETIRRQYERGRKLLKTRG